MPPSSPQQRQNALLFHALISLCTELEDVKRLGFCCRTGLQWCAEWLCDLVLSGERGVQDFEFCHRALRGMVESRAQDATLTVSDLFNAKLDVSPENSRRLARLVVLGTLFLPLASNTQRVAWAKQHVQGGQVAVDELRDFFSGRPRGFKNAIQAEYRRRTNKLTPFSPFDVPRVEPLRKLHAPPALIIITPISQDAGCDVSDYLLTDTQPKPSIL